MEATDYLTHQQREIEEALRTALATEDPDVKRRQFLGPTRPSRCAEPSAVSRRAGRAST